MVPVSHNCLTYSSVVKISCLVCYHSTDFMFTVFHILEFSCVTDDDYYEDEEEDDPDALKDPIYQIDLQVHSVQR